MTRCKVCRQLSTAKCEVFCEHMLEITVHVTPKLLNWFYAQKEKKKHLRYSKTVRYNYMGKKLSQ